MDPPTGSNKGWFKNLKIIQWNARSIRSKVSFLRRYSSTGDIFLISETHLEGNQNFILPGFDSIHWNRVGKGGGGVAILIRSSLKYEKYPKKLYDCDSKLEICSINVFTNNQKKITIASCYRPPDDEHKIEKGEWEKFFDQFDNQVLVGGDFNLHHQFWG